MAGTFHHGFSPPPCGYSAFRARSVLLFRREAAYMLILPTQKEPYGRGIAHIFVADEAIRI